MSRHIAIISTLPSDEFHLPGFPTDHEQIAAGLQAHAPDWRFSYLSVTEGRLPPLPAQVDGVVFSGSPASVNEDALWIRDVLALIRDLHARRVPMFGICFGHQAIAKALGGRVAARAGGWSLGLKQVAWGDQTLCLSAVHTEEVTDLPAGAEVVAQTETCPIAGFGIGAHVLTTQHHPEMSRAFLEALLDKLARDADAGLDPATLALARASLGAPMGNAQLMGRVAAFFDAALRAVPDRPRTAA